MGLPFPAPALALLMALHMVTMGSDMVAADSTNIGAIQDVALRKLWPKCTGCMTSVATQVTTRHHVRPSVQG